jgi:acetyl-CoA carboxylase biotin carboxyl carrier protein
VSLSANDVAEILKALEASSFDTLDLEMNGVKVSLRRGTAGVAARPVPQLQQASAQQTPAQPAVAAVPATVPGQAPPRGAKVVPAPLLGIFYHAPKPGEPPFVTVGSRVTEDSIIGIIEVMKLMNTVRAGLRGEIVAIPAANGELVEFGAALLFVRPD